MKIFFVLSIFTVLVLFIYQLASGFPFLSRMKEKRREKQWKERQKQVRINTAKIQHLTPTLEGKEEVEKYIEWNRFHLPEGGNWATLLPSLIQELLAIGWTTKTAIYTKYKYGRYEFHLATSDQKIIDQARPIFHKYLDLYEEK